MFKNNFLWEFVLLSKFQNPIEKFDKEFWGKVGKSVKGVKKITNRLVVKTKEMADKSARNL
jgi:hypothetical protein